MMPLEDDFTYVLRKALKGLNLSPSEAAERAGLPETGVMALLRGKFSEAPARRLAPVLALHEDALASHPHYQPRPLAADAIRQLDVPFGDGQVNAWIIHRKALTFLFDTACSPAFLEKALEHEKIAAAFITHAHEDHTSGIPMLLERGVQVFGPDNIGEVDPIAAGQTLNLGGFTVKAFALPGHCEGALGYRIDGFDRTLCVVGDALFAGSIGGCATPELYQAALHSLRHEVLSLPGDTILLPGHGPATTVDEELKSNPFLATVALAKTRLIPPSGDDEI